MSESRSFNNSQSTTDSPSQSVNANEILRAIQSSQAAAIEAASATAARMVEEKFAVLKQDLTEEAATKAAKKAKADKRPVFKRKGNEHQYEHNAAVLDKVDEAIDFLNREDIAKTQESLKQGRNLILKRQKLIRLADREECGWDVVQEYLSDELASDSDDEKHIVRSRKDHRTAVLATRGACHRRAACIVLIMRAPIVRRTSQAKATTSGPIQPPDKTQFALRAA